MFYVPQDENVENSDAFVKTISQSIDMFINRMQTVQLKGKHVAMDSTVQVNQPTLFLTFIEVRLKCRRGPSIRNYRMSKTDTFLLGKDSSV